MHKQKKEEHDDSKFHRFKLKVKDLLSTVNNQSIDLIILIVNTYRVP